MRKRKLAAGFMTAVMTLALCLGAGVPVRAAGDGAALAEDVQGAVKKELVMDEHVTTPAATFQFEIQKATGTVKDAAGKDVTELLEADGPELSIANISFSKASESTTVEGVKTVSGESKIAKADGSDLDGAYFEKAGIFAYEITEKANTYTIEDPTKEKMTYSKAKYTIFIRVLSKNGSLVIDSIQGMVTADDAGNSVSYEKVETKPGKTEMAFRNIYSKTGGTGEDGKDWDAQRGALSISKEVGGDGDQQKEFDFSLTLHKNAILDMEAAQNGGKYPTYTVTLPGSAEQLTYQFDAKTSQITNTFKLKHGQKIIFTDVPVGTWFELSENGGTAIPNYITTIEGKSNGAAFTVKAMRFDKKLVGEGSNYADVHNDYNDNPITGIVVKNLPFIVLIGAAVLGLAAYVVVKRRRFVK